MIFLSDLKGLNNTILCFDEKKLQDKLSLCREYLDKSADYELETDTVLLDSFHSATIEGARTTIESVRRSLRDPKSKSDRMVVNNMNALNLIYSGYPVSDQSLRTLWETVVKDVCENERLKGVKYRSGNVTISSYERVIHTPAPYKKIESYMAGLFQFMDRRDLDAIYKAIIVHFYFVYIHPYCDGNGRTARILQNYSLFQAGYPGVRRIRISQAINFHLGGYYKSLEMSEIPIVLRDQVTLNLTVFMDYMLDRIIEACRFAEKKQDHLSALEKKLLIRMSRRGIGAEITVTAAAGILGISDGYARKILNGLSKKEYLFKTKIEGKNKNLYRLLVLISK